MDLANTTRNQHYLPQVEQRLNAANPHAPLNRQRIYSFEVVDHERLALRLESPLGRRISENLAIGDLFTFDVASDRKSRLNFEALFGRYEARVHEVSMRLFARVRRDFTGMESRLLTIGDCDFYRDLVDLFTVKLLNFARNPHSITKVMNTFGALAGYHPTDPRSLAYFERVLNGRRPHQKWLCSQLGISEEAYERWLQMLFMLFVEFDRNGTDFLSGMVKSLFESGQHVVGVMVCTYDNPVCLVSDRAFSTNIDKAGVDGFDFNLCSRAFVRYTFGSVGALAPQAPSSVVDRFRRPPRELYFHHQHNNLTLLGSFNRNVIYQSARRVYSATTEPLVPLGP